MAHLNVVVHGNPTTAAAGNRNPAAILISVTNSAGVPVTGIPAANVKYNTMLVGALGSDVVASSFGALTFAGYYRLEVVPIGTANWVMGEFDIAIVVKNNIGDTGQSIAHFHVP